MKEGIHPNYEATTVNCHCGSSFETNLLKVAILLRKYVLNATLSIPVSRS